MEVPQAVPVGLHKRPPFIIDLTLLVKAYATQCFVKGIEMIKQAFSVGELLDVLNFRGGKR